jgi:hypothetical protein
MLEILTQAAGRVERSATGAAGAGRPHRRRCAILDAVTSAGVPLVARLHIDLQRVGSAACPDLRA